MRMFDVGNRHRTGFWVAAESEARAVEIAVEFGHIREPKNARVTDVTDQYRNQDGTFGIRERTLMICPQQRRPK